MTVLQSQGNDDCRLSKIISVYVVSSSVKCCLFSSSLSVYVKKTECREMIEKTLFFTLTTHVCLKILNIYARTSQFYV